MTASNIETHLKIQVLFQDSNFKNITCSATSKSSVSIQLRENRRIKRSNFYRSNHIASNQQKYNINSSSTLRIKFIWKSHANNYFHINLQFITLIIKWASLKIAKYLRVIVNFWVLLMIKTDRFLSLSINFTNRSI